MKSYACTKCGSVDLILKDNGSQKGLYCAEGCGWIKWVSKKEIPIVEEFIKENKVCNTPETTYGIMTLKDYLKQKKFELEVDNNAYNRGMVKGLEIAIKIMEAK